MPDLLLGLALLEGGHPALSYTLLERASAGIVGQLRRQGGVFQWTDALSGAGGGLPGHASGIVPLYWLLNLWGVAVRDARSVFLLGPFQAPRKIGLRQHGVRINRSTRKLAIKFPSGNTLEVPPDAPPQLLQDARG
ncbi:MAG: hypothetical protein HC915_15745 [Anaerolineae bacterium]|nr:hypothetical protein [Anaerolineae bacterium]